METTTELILDPNDPAEREMMIGERHFSLQQRKANVLSSSGIVPQIYQGNLANCMIAMEMAERLNTGVMEIMQNLYVVHGNPAFSSKYLIAMINMSNILTGRLRFNFVGQDDSDDYGCFAVGTEAETGKDLVGTTVTVAMAKKQGWYSKAGSKWPSMTDQMLQYRAAAFWSRINAPEATMGMTTVEEQQDITERDITPGAPQVSAGAGSVNEMLKKAPAQSQVIEHGQDIDQHQTIDGDQQAAEGLDITDSEDESGATQAPEWPMLVDGIWCDSAGENYDSIQHLFPEGADHPTVNSDGTFRKKPVRKAKEAGQAQQPAKTEPAGANPFDIINARISAAQNQADFDSILQMEEWASVYPAGKQALQENIEAKKSALAMDFDV